MHLIMVLPSTNAVWDRSFSTMRHIYTSTMNQDCLNHQLLLHVRNERTDSLSLIAVANGFVGDSDNRLSAFGCIGDNEL